MGFADKNRELLERHVVFYLPEQIENCEFFGYDIQKKAALEIGLTVLEGEPCFVEILGIPGSGKTSFVQRTAYTLNHSFDSHYSLMSAKCDKLLRMITSGQATSSDVIQILENRVNQAWDNKPAIVFFDEIDSLSPPISDSDPQFALLTKWIRAYCEEEAVRAEKTFTIGTTNYPDVVDFSVKRRMGISMFFEEPSKQVVSQMIGMLLGTQNESGIGDTVFDELKKRGVVPLASDVIIGCRQFMKRCATTQNIPFKQKCDDLATLIGGSPRNRIERYYNHFASEIKTARLQTEYYAKQFDQKHKGATI